MKHRMVNLRRDRTDAIYRGKAREPYSINLHWHPRRAVTLSQLLTSNLHGMSGDYKSSKEAFVSGMTGSSVIHINMISAVALVRTDFSITASSRLTECSVRLPCTQPSGRACPSPSQCTSRQNG